MFIFNFHLTITILIKLWSLTMSTDNANMSIKDIRLHNILAVVLSFLAKGIYASRDKHSNHKNNLETG
jgi:hypothetical protein